VMLTAKLKSKNEKVKAIECASRMTIL
jgi:hypothetical protein